MSQCGGFVEKMTLEAPGNRTGFILVTKLKILFRNKLQRKKIKLSILIKIHGKSFPVLFSKQFFCTLPYLLEKTFLLCEIAF